MIFTLNSSFKCKKLVKWCEMRVQMKVLSKKWVGHGMEIKSQYLGIF